jgi:trehalose-6-phosphate synthase
METPEIECEGYIKNPHNYTEIANKILIAVSKDTEEEKLQRRASLVKEIFDTAKAAEKYASLFGI